jgi:TetR/AcrR family transcriptional repressor of nem operon
MGRKKSYDREVLVEKAMAVFREHGFAGTSADMLVERLGVNRYSIYAEFGSKQGLYDASLAKYNQENLGRNFGPLESEGAGIEEIRTLFEFFGAAESSPGLGRGCLFCNTAVEFGPHDPSGAGFVQQYFERISGAFRTALGNAKAEGRIDRLVVIDREASFFTSAVLGMFVMLRAKAPTAIFEGAAQAAISHLESLRADDR